MRSSTARDFTVAAARRETARCRRAEQADFEHANLFPWAADGFDGFVRHFRARAHEDDHALGVGRALIIEQVIVAAGQKGELVHGVLHDGGRGEVERIAGFARLEVDVRVLGACRESRGGPATGRARGAPSPGLRRSWRACRRGKAVRLWPLHGRCGNRRRNAGRARATSSVAA